MLVEGHCGANLYGVARVWDLVAPHVLATEVGCVATALDGRRLDYSSASRDPGRRYSWCVAPPRIHAEVQAIVARHSRAVR
jgi:myo-inositol-1(or 4)-monophosphatase